MRIANCSGFYGDRLSAAREMVEGGPIDVLTGDWLAELTMLILAGNRLKGRPGYAPTFLRQLEEVLGHLPGPRHQGRVQRGRPGPGRLRRRRARAGRPARPVPRKVAHVDRRRPAPAATSATLAERSTPARSCAAPRR